MLVTQRWRQVTLGPAFWEPNKPVGALHVGCGGLGNGGVRSRLSWNFLHRTAATWETKSWLMQKVDEILSL